MRKRMNESWFFKGQINIFLQNNIVRKSSCFVLLLVFSFFGCVTNNNLTYSNSDLVNEKRVFLIESGDVSIIPPDGWLVVYFPEMQYKVIMGGQAERENGFTPVITTITGTYNTTTFNEMVDKFSEPEYLQERLDIIEEILLLSCDDFSTLKNLMGKRIIFITTTSGGDRIRLYFYIFPAKDKVALFVQCLIQREAGDTFDEIFDNMAKTLEWTQMY